MTFLGYYAIARQDILAAVTYHMGGGGGGSYAPPAGSCKIPARFVIGSADFLYNLAKTQYSTLTSKGHETAWIELPGVAHKFDPKTLPETWAWIQKKTLCGKTTPGSCGPGPQPADLGTKPVPDAARIVWLAWVFVCARAELVGHIVTAERKRATRLWIVLCSVVTRDELEGYPGLHELRVGATTDARVTSTLLWGGFSLTFRRFSSSELTMPRRKSAISGVEKHPDGFRVTYIDPETGKQHHAIRKNRAEAYAFAARQEVVAELAKMKQTQPVNFLGAEEAFDERSLDDWMRVLGRGFRLLATTPYNEDLERRVKAAATTFAKVAPLLKVLRKETREASPEDAEKMRARVAELLKAATAGAVQ